jgi:NAD(P)-dependent dehydrogenase (short-subunit alcohol dehydrogenase family)
VKEVNELQGKYCVVTGANSGIGIAICKELALKGATVVMVCRSSEKGNVAKSAVELATGSKQIEMLVQDLSSLQNVRSLAKEYAQNHEKLHVLINNAGVVQGTRKVTSDGLEYVFVVNYLAHFLLTNLLLSTIKQSAPARIVNVVSSVHTHIDFDDLQLEKHYSAIRSYGQSKLAQILFTFELAKRLEGTKLSVNCVHPGAVRTHLGDEGGLVGIGIRIARLFYASPEKGAEGPVYLATGAELEGVTGKYFSKKKEKRIEYSEEDSKRLWNVSMKLCGLDGSDKESKE